MKAPIRYQIKLVLLGGKEQPYARPYEFRKGAEGAIARLTKRLDEGEAEVEGFCYCKIEEIFI